MLDKILGINYDFFDPNLQDELNCKLMFDPQPDHLVTCCNEGVGRVMVINAMAQKIALSDSRPTWQHRNGSIDLKKLRQIIEMTDAVAQKLLTDKGYVKVSDLHIFGREAICKWSEVARAKSRCNPCPIENNEVRGCIKEAIFSPAIAMRIRMGKRVNFRASKELFKELPEPIKLNRFKVINISEPTLALKEIEKANENQFWVRIGRITIFSVLAFCALYTFYSRGNLNTLIEHFNSSSDFFTNKTINYIIPGIVFRAT